MAGERAVRRRGVAKRHFVDFYLGASHYAVPIGAVREILRPMAITPLPHPDPSVLGIANIRGEVIPVIDLHQRLGIPRATEAGARAKWLFLRVGTQSLAIPIDRMGHVFGETPAMEPAPQLDQRSDWIAGVVRHEGTMVLVLHVDRLVTEGREHLSLS